MKKITSTLICLLSFSAFGKNYLDENLRQLNWNGIEVVWLEDDSLPTFDVIFYFDQGALSDPKKKAGLTELMFSELTSGTKNFSQGQIIESLEFFGVSYGSRVTHEFSSFAVSGLQKNFNPSLKLVCQLFKDSQYPKKELKKSKRRILSSMKSIVSNHSALADQVFRAETMKGSGYDMPTTGLMKTIQRIGSNDLKQRLTSLNKNAFKKIYLKGGKDLLQLENIIKNDCEWKQAEKRNTYPVVKNYPRNKELILVPVAKANQAQVRIGRMMNSDETGAAQHELKAFSAKFLGGGFSSRLVQGLRVEKGLTYSAGAYVSEQRKYGRIGIVTSTANKTIVELLKSTEKILADNISQVNEDLFKLSVNNAKGNYLLGLESSSDFLKNLMYFDHVGRKYEEIYKYSDRIGEVEPKDLQEMIKRNFNIQDQTIVILGDKSLEKPLKEAGYKIRKVKYQDYL